MAPNVPMTRPRTRREPTPLDQIPAWGELAPLEASIGNVRVAKPGVIFAAQMTGLPIVPIAFASKKKSCWAPGIA